MHITAAKEVLVVYRYEGRTVRPSICLSSVRQPGHPLLMFSNEQVIFESY